MNDFLEGIRWVAFDFDGVLCDSVRGKSAGFQEWVQQVAPDKVDEFMEYHMNSYGIGRLLQIDHLFTQIMGEPLSPERLQQEAGRLGELIDKNLASVELFPGALQLCQGLRHSGRKVSILSGTPQADLEKLVEIHGLSALMERVVGTPTKKKDGLHAILRDGDLQPHELLFVGDAQADWDAATATGVHFLYRPSEVPFPSTYNGAVLTSLDINTEI